MTPSNSLDSDSAARARFPFTLTGVFLIVALYTSVHALTRLFASGNLGEDDPLDNLLIQTLAPGYSVHQGPLYDWALWAIQQFAGTGLSGFLFLKYGLLVLMAGCLFHITWQLTRSALWAFIAVESMATVYQIFWRFHEGFTHRVGAMALAVATVWALLRLIDQPGRGKALVLAILIGLGLLTEHIYVFALLAALTAAWIQPPARQTVFSMGTLLWLPVTLLIVLPYASWLLAEPHRLSELQTSLFPEVPAHTLAGMAAGVRDALTFPLLVLSPYIVVLPMVFPAIFRTIFRESALRSKTPDAFDPKLFLFHILLIQLAGLIIFNGLLYTRANYAVHSILPMMVIAIPWLTAKALETKPSAKRVKVFMAVLLAFTITAYAVRSGNLFVYEPFCSRCRWGVPYADLADRLRDLGFKQGEIVTNDPMIGGNLRRFFPESHVSLNERKGEAGNQAYVWNVSGDEQGIPGPIRQLIPASQVPAEPEMIKLPWKHWWKPLGYRNSTWAAVVIERPD
ncbi:MAG: hypothetical protein H6R14_2063 [Proteobacteria bacterium]|nr:hypothetical protein [Pseudomonadota bacterium]